MDSIWTNGIFCFSSDMKRSGALFLFFSQNIAHWSGIQPLWEQVAELLLTPDPEKLLSCSALMKTELFPDDWHVNCITCAEAWDTPECG